MSQQITKRWYSAVTAQSRYIDASHGPADFPFKDLHVFPDLLNREEQEIMVRMAKAKLRKFRFESGHIDNVITGYFFPNVRQHCDKALMRTFAKAIERVG